METTTDNQRDPVDQGLHNFAVGMSCGRALIQHMLDCLTGTRRPETPAELPANVLPYPQRTARQPTVYHLEPATVELCPSAGAHPDMDIATLLNRTQQAGVRVDVKGVRGKVQL